MFFHFSLPSNPAMNNWTSDVIQVHPQVTAPVCQSLSCSHSSNTSVPVQEDLEDFDVVSSCAVSKHVPVLRNTAGNLQPDRRENLLCSLFSLASCLLCCYTRSGTSYISLIWKWFPSKKECQGWLKLGENTARLCGSTWPPSRSDSTAVFITSGKKEREKKKKENVVP